MMSSELEEYVFAYYVANGADALQMDPRFWPYAELVMIIEDKVRFAIRKFGPKAESACASVARAFLDLMIDRQGFSKTGNDPGAMYRYQGDKYRECIVDLKKTNTIILRAQDAGPAFWEEAFAGLSGDR